MNDLIFNLVKVVIQTIIFSFNYLINMNKSVYEFTDYKLFIRANCQARRWPLKRLAERCRLQPPFLSKVLRHDIHLNDQQLDAIAAAFELDSEHAEYLHLLWRANRASYHEARRMLLDKVRRIRAEKMDLTKSLHERTKVISEAQASKLPLYYSDERCQALHMGLLIKKFQREPKLLAQCLGLTSTQLERCLSLLVAMGFVAESDGLWLSLQPSVHLRNDDPMARANHRMWRMRALVNDSHSAEAYRLSATIAASKVEYDELRESLKLVIAQHGHRIETTEADLLYQVNIDLFDLAR